MNLKNYIYMSRTKYILYLRPNISSTRYGGGGGGNNAGNTISAYHIQFLTYWKLRVYIIVIF